MLSIIKLLKGFNIRKSVIWQKLLILIGLCCLFLLSSSQPNADRNVENHEKTEKADYKQENIKVSKTLAKIHIDNNWSAAKIIGICTGEGTFSDPYLIENQEISETNIVHCILIENSNAFFKIMNCNLTNAEIILY